jgi:protoporphyrinogen/coproporphyrinogen III oxidase
MKKTIEVIGAGASGLFLTRALLKQGYKVSVFEERYSIGGMVQTLESPWGRIETAANAFLNSLELEALAKDLGIQLIEGEKSSRRRYVFNGGKARAVGPFSLGFFRGIKLLFQYFFFREKILPLKQESVLAFGERVLGKRVTHQLLIPALQGIYAGDPSQLSASLLFSKYLKKKDPNAPRLKKTKLGRTVSPEGGMESFFYALYLDCVEKGAEFHFGTKVKEGPSGKQVRVYTGNPKAIYESLPSALKKEEAPSALGELDVLPLTSVALFFDEAPDTIRPGFGILFPRTEGVQSLGVLFSPWIFRERSPIHAETWIIGGALDREAHLKSDEDLLKLVLADREKALDQTIPPKFSRIQRWPLAIPHFNLQLEEKIEAKQLANATSQSVYFFGTFLGSLGIGSLLGEAERFVTSLESEA